MVPDIRCVIYGLSLDGVDIRYVGLTSGRLRLRWYAHVHAARNAKSRTAVRCWIMAHGPANIHVTVLEKCSSAEDLFAAEQRWISQLRAAGSRLLNHTDGGEGTLGWSPTDRQRAAQSARVAGPGNPNFGRPRTEDTKQLIREKLTGRPGATRGVPKTEEHKEKLRGRTISDETRRRMSESAVRRGANNKGVPMSEEQKEKLRRAATGRTMSSEARAKMSEAGRGRPKSPEHRAKIAEAVRRARAPR